MLVAGTGPLGEPINFGRAIDSAATFIDKLSLSTAELVSPHAVGTIVWRQTSQALCEMRGWLAFMVQHPCAVYLVHDILDELGIARDESGEWGLHALASADPASHAAWSICIFGHAQ
ncbi:hypothetical protein HK105_209217 [Polyrhizophydium stewartii]|uniref:Uncharacterized protein n=1 Tax=Polyrhizophydium stewartii TaxID=2732419 RepID=A0ABR4MVP2_9FUNG